MAKMRLYPHQTADPDAVRWGEWWLFEDGQRTPLPNMLKGWDYASEVTVGLSPMVDVELLLASTRQTDLEALEVLLVADCREVQDRFLARRRLSEVSPGVPEPIALVLPAGCVAGSVRLSAHVVLSRALPASTAGVACLKGARLASSDPTTLLLEGNAGRFPTEAVAFSELGFDSAPWTMLFSYGDLNDSFMGGVRLLVNTEHPVGQLALDSKQGDRVAGLMRYDVMRTLLMRVAFTDGGVTEERFAEGSVGDVLNTMSLMYAQRDLRSMARLIAEDFEAAERLLHDRLTPLASVIG